MMRRRFHCLLFLLAAVLPMAAGTGCVESFQPETEHNTVELPILVYVPEGEMPATKASAGDVRALNDEKALHDLQVWMYTHQTPVAEEGSGDAEGAVAYLCLKDIENMTGAIEVTMPLPGYILDRSDDNLRFDFYVLGNGRSVGIDLSKTDSLRRLTRGALKQRLLSGVDTSGFGSRMVDTVPSKGLPMTCFFNNDGAGFDLSFLKMNFTSNQMRSMKSLNGQDYDATSETVANLQLTKVQKTFVEAHCISEGKWDWTTMCPQVTIVRAISRLRFVFAKTLGLAETGITCIELVDDADAGVIPESTFLFPRELMPAGGYYPSTSVYELLMWGSDDEPLLSDADIQADEDPLRLRSISNTVDPLSNKAPAAMDAQEYENFLKAWVGENTSTQKVLYVRESDKTIQGRIHYRLGEKTGVAPFCMDSDPATNFHRNHAWTIYAYFSQSQLFFEITPDPWIGSGDTGHHLKK